MTWGQFLSPILSRWGDFATDRRVFLLGPFTISATFLYSPILPFITRRKAMHYAFDEYERGRGDAGLNKLPGVAKQFYLDGWDACREAALKNIDDYATNKGWGGFFS